MTDAQLNFIETHLKPEILAKLSNEELLSFQAEHSAGIDGFMSALYNIKLTTKTAKGEKHRLLIAKFMRGDVNFRETSKSYIQFANEIYIYATVLPAYEKLVEKYNITNIRAMDTVAPCYKAAFGYIEGLSATPTEREACLVLENLKPLGYQLGPRLVLNMDHLLAMCKPLGQHHAFSYALRALDDAQLQRLKSGITTLPFVNDKDPEDAEKNLFRLIYRIAFDRFYEFFDRKVNTATFDRKSPKDLRLIENLQKLKEKYFTEPARLMERLRTKVEERDEDRKFAAILHGDYNRNNVLFKYRQEGGGEQQVEDVKMIDFQELRYGSPILDLSFFMYFNSSKETRENNWLDILKAYHTSMYSTLSTILQASGKSAADLDVILQHYSFAKFQEHFARFAFYGAMICLHFLPWMLCSEEECTRLSELFASDMHGEEFRQLSIDAGGDEVNLRMLDVLRHASDMGYMDDL